MKIREQDIPSLIRQGKDKEVIPLLYKTVFPKVNSYIRKNSGSRQDADDIFQDAVLLFYRQVVDGSFNDKYTIFGYLYRVCINRYINKIKKDRRMVFVEELGDEPMESQDSEWDSSGIEMVIRHENILEKLFSGIGEKCVEVLTCTIYYNLMMEDIMIRMGFTSEGAVKMQLKRCKEKLMKEIENNPQILKKLKGYE
jgi:RNA polymerase sigma factor (sigma-70 family)